MLEMLVGQIPYRHQLAPSLEPIPSALVRGGVEERKAI